MESMVTESLHVVARLLGADVAEQTARWMEYKHWKGSEYWLND